MDLQIYTDIQKRIGLENNSVISQNIDWFNNEAENRDQIVYNYFGKDTFETLVSLISEKILTDYNKTEITILDTGIGAGTFSLPIYDNLKELKIENINYYGLDISLKMLQVLNNKTNKIIPLIGRLENIKTSLDHHRKILDDIPEKFDFVLATLVIHHIPDIEQAFRSINEVLKPNGKLIILDMLEHPPDLEEPEAHPGFDLNELAKLGRIDFKNINIESLKDLTCSSLRYSADLFIGELSN